MKTNLGNLKVTDKIVEYIQKEIQKGNLKAGEKLPSEANLANKLGVSRASLREALKKLELAGLIEIKHGQGSFVCEDPSLKALVNIIPSLLLSTNSGILTLLEARRFIEIGTARLAAKNATKEDLERLNDTMNEMRIAKEEGDNENFELNDLQFHLGIAKASDNPVLRTMVKSLKKLMTEQLEVILQIPGRIDSSLKLHDKICKAISEGDNKEAGQLMDQHIKNAERDFKKSHSESSNEQNEVEM